jgi:carboxypeptidase D
MRITRTGTANSDFDISIAPDGTWADFTNLLFVDQPVGTGFSWGKSYATNLDDTASEFVNYFMMNLYTLFPEFVGREIYLAGESYAGKFVPRYAQEMLNFNKA